MLVNGYEGNYNQIFIYNDNGEILYKTERNDLFNIDLEVKIRNARKLSFDKKDCFEVKTSGKNTYLFRNGKDLYIHNSIIDVIKITEKKQFEHSGETDYKNIYTLKLNYDNGKIIEVESDYYTRTEKTDDRLEREKIAKIIAECLFGKSCSHYEVEQMLKKLDITIK